MQFPTVHPKKPSLISFKQVIIFTVICLTWSLSLLGTLLIKLDQTTVESYIDNLCNSDSHG